MKALAIETSGRVGSVAIVDDGNVLEEREFSHGLKHAAGILSMIDDLCRTRGWTPADLGELYVSVGPGSFTGLRIGITFAKTAAFASGMKIVAVPTVRVLAENAPSDARHVVIVLDAKRDQIFTAYFERVADGWSERTPAHLGSLTQMLDVVPRPMHLLGEGIPYHDKFLPPNAIDCGIIVTPEALWRARASAAAKIGMEMSRRGEFADPYRLTPLYIRRPEAEEKYEILNAPGNKMRQ